MTQTHGQILEAGILDLPWGFFDRHLHLREGAMMNLVLPHSAKQAWGGIIMPNLGSPLTTWQQAQAYAHMIDQVSVANGILDFEPFMTCYLTDNTDLGNLSEGFTNGNWSAVKFYPWGATTNSNNGITSIEKAFPAFELMEKIGMPLLVHGELAHDTLDPLQFEAMFLEEILVSQILTRFPGLKVVLEHVTTHEAVALVVSENYNLWATVTPQHLLFSHRHLFQSGKMQDGTFKRGIRPRLWCMPILKMEAHRKAMLDAVCSGSTRFGAGTDSAPHGNSAKYQDFGCGGCFTSPFAIEMYATAFQEGEALHHLPAFLGRNLIEDVYGIKITENEFDPKIILRKQPQLVPNDVTDPVNLSSLLSVENLLGGQTLDWTAIIQPE